jgi:intracellular sulfur oxidation DsrE/DsrF family protein
MKVSSCDRGDDVHHQKGVVHVCVRENTAIDVPVRLSEVNVVFSIGSLSFEGDLPASIFHMQLIGNDIAEWSAQSKIIAVFHTNAGHVTLHDKGYDSDRNIATGNPYKNLIADLQKRGVQVELCGATAKVHGWANEDLLPGIKVNTDAMARTTQLVQEGFVKMTE